MATRLATRMHRVGADSIEHHPWSGANRPPHDDAGRKLTLHDIPYDGGTAPLPTPFALSPPRPVQSHSRVRSTGLTDTRTSSLYLYTIHAHRAANTELSCSKRDGCTELFSGESLVTSMKNVPVAYGNQRSRPASLLVLSQRVVMLDRKRRRTACSLSKDPWLIRPSLSTADTRSEMHCNFKISR
jgi:hypothetical protein